MTDRSEVEAVLFHPVIFDAISEDGAPQQIPQAHYLGGYVDDVCVGVVLVNFLSRHAADVHIQVLPEHRKQHALTLGLEAKRWLFDYGMEKLVAQIPFCCENVKNFALKIGFQVEGINRKRWLKKGQFWDSWYLGCLRGE